MQKFSSLLILLSLVMAGCSADIPDEPEPIELTAILPTAVPTSTPQPPTPQLKSAIEIAIEAILPTPGTVALDFVSLACSATWSSSIVFTACPGDPDDLDDGYVLPLLDTIIETGEIFEVPSLLTIPPQAESRYGGIFGRYPGFTVQPGDRFRAVLTCQRAPCEEVEYALDTYNANGVFQPFPTYMDNPLAEYNHGGSDFVSIDLSLEYLVGQTVDFVLVVRDQSYLQGDRYLWVAPHIYRDPANTSATPLPPIGSSSGASTPRAANATESSEGIPGVIAGYVDMRTAPPYLNDPITTNRYGVPVVMVFFNLDDGTWWWIHTTQTHPNFQMTVTPGTYHVVAYAIGVAGQPYVAGAYTGGAASCGANLATVEVGSNAHINNIIITDWCPNSDRPSKPNEVPLP